VINVIREEIPRAYPEEIEGTVALEGTSVNRGATAAGSVLLPVGGSYALRGEASLRRSADFQTPLGELPNTDSKGLNLALGGSWLPGWGFAGLSYRAYFLDHGIPGEFQGVQIPGGHPGGVSAETRRQVGRAQLGHFDGVGPFGSLQLEGNLVHYTHKEIEGTLDSGEPIIGTDFDQITATLNTVAHHEHTPGSVRVSGAVGAFGSYRDLLTGGSYPGARDARETNFALFLHEELGVGRYRLQAGVRYDWIQVEPIDLEPIDTGSEEVPVRTRSFGSAAASLAGLIDIHPGWILGAGLARAFRAPSVSELFSAGPHLADFSYDIGNPELGTETGLGVDLFLRVNRPGINLEATVFHNRIRNFIHSRPTGEADPRFGRFPLFRAIGADAVFSGADGSLAVELLPSLVLDGTVSYVRAEYSDTGEPLPSIPPFSGSIRARYEVRSYFVAVGWDGRAGQERVPFSIANPVPGEPDLVPEIPTAGSGLLHVNAGIRWYSGEFAHSVTLSVDNALNRAWRDHLSRAKEVAPEAGRNLQILYRFSF
jgi:iron complex outermembrane receptor protein